MKKWASAASAAAIIAICGGLCLPARAEVLVPSEGAVLNICCENDELKARMAEHFPGYEDLDTFSGRIGDVSVRWDIGTGEASTYEDKVLRLIVSNADKAPDARIDLFVAGDGMRGMLADEYADHFIPVSKLGIKTGELRKMFPYTLDAVRNGDGEVMALAWQAAPGALMYNRQIAADILGTDDPAEVGEMVSDWESFKETAGKMAAVGYQVTSSIEDLLPVFCSGEPCEWVGDDGKVKIPESVKPWAELSRSFVYNGASTTAAMWGSDWMKGLQEGGNIFCTFCPKWIIDFCLGEDDDNSVASAGGWAVCEGPEPFWYGGSWMYAAAVSDNTGLVTDIMRTMTTDKDTLSKMARIDGDFVNSREVMEAASKEGIFESEILGGQDPTEVFLNNAKAIKAGPASRYAEEAEKLFLESMREYLLESVTYEEAEERFLAAMKNASPELG